MFRCTHPGENVGFLRSDRFADAVNKLFLGFGACEGSGRAYESVRHARQAQAKNNTGLE
ncbi:MAG: hypothetical protein Q7J51_02035 [Sheuella sp.]|nr:hypothetical protein [Sheuella sp.]